jgi:hypothetical protein
MKQVTIHTAVLLKPSGALYWSLVCVFVTMPLFQFSLVNLGERGLLRIDLIGILIFLAIFALRFALRFGNTRQGLWELHCFSTPALVFWYVSLLTMVNLFDASPKRLEDFLTVTAQLTLNIAVFLAISGLRMRKDTLAKLVRVWVAVACLMSSYAIYQLIARIYDWPLAWVQYTNPSYGAQHVDLLLANPDQRAYYIRPAALLGEPSYLSGYLIGPLLILLALRSSRESGIHVFGSSGRDAIALLVLALGFLFTLAIGPTFALMATISTALVTRPWGARFALRAIIVVLVASIVLFGVSTWSDLDLVSFLIDRFLSLISFSAGMPTEPSLYWRVAGSAIALQEWLQHPILGCGLGCIAAIAERSSEPSVVMSSAPWVTLLVEQGIMGMVALLYLVVRIVAKLHSQIRQQHPDSEVPLVMGIYLVLWSELFLGLTTHSWNTQPERWIVMGLAGAIARNLSEKQQ